MRAALEAEGPYIGRFRKIMSVLIKFRLLLNFDHARRRKSGFIGRSDSPGGP